MAKVLIVYATRDGHTELICQRLSQSIEDQGCVAIMMPVDCSLYFRPADYDKIVIGSSIRYGKHDPQIVDFIKRNKSVLEDKPSAFFSVNLVARKPEKAQPETNPYLQKFLKQILWKPNKLAVFAGKLNYPSYGFLDRFMIRLIMRMTKGPTDPKAVVEFTDWAQVESFGRVVAKSL